MKKLQLLIIIALLGLGSLIGAGRANAANTTGLTLSPPSYQMRANPGDSLTNSIRITNNSDYALSVQVSAEDFTVTDHEGSVAVATSPAPHAFSAWFSFPTAKIALAAKASAMVPFSIHVPKDAEPGGHFASILFSPTLSSSTNSTGASVIQRIGSLVLLSINGNVVENASITQFRPKTFSGSWDQVLASDGKTKILVPSNEELTKEQPRRFFSHGPVAFDLIFKNSGNTYFAPTGTVTIYNLFGRKVDQLPIDPHNVFPGSQRRITVIWPEKNLTGFYYRAAVTAVYGGQNKILTASTIYYGFPMAYLIAIIVFIVLLVLLRKRLLAALRALIKGR